MANSKATQFNLVHATFLLLAVILTVIAFYVQPAYLCVNLIFIFIEFYFFIVGLSVKIQGKFYYLSDFFDGYVKKENYKHACNRFFIITAAYTISMVCLCILFIMIKGSIFTITVLFITSLIIYCILLCGLLKKYDESKKPCNHNSPRKNFSENMDLFEDYMHIDDVD